MSESPKPGIEGGSPVTPQATKLTAEAKQQAMRILLQGLEGLSAERKAAILSDIKAGKPFGKPDAVFGVDEVEGDDFFDEEAAQCQLIPGTTDAYVYNSVGAMQVTYLLSKLFPKENIRLRIAPEQIKHIKLNTTQYSGLGITRGISRHSEDMSIGYDLNEGQLDEDSPEFEERIREVDSVPIFDRNMKGMWSSDGMRTYPVILDEKWLPIDSYLRSNGRIGLMLYPAHGNPDPEFFR